MAVISLQVDPCYYRKVQNSRLRWCPCLSKALVEKTMQEWNSLSRVDLAMFQMRLSLCAAILTKLSQQVNHRNQLSVLLGQHDVINFCNLSRLILKKGGFTPELANHKKGIFLIENSILGRRSANGKAAFQSNSKF